MLQRIAALLSAENAQAYGAAAARAKATAQPTLAAMSEATIAIWREALALERATASLQGVSAQRCLAALRYVPWTPPPPVAPALAPSEPPSRPKPNGALALVARAALSIRHTFAGRVLYRIAPKPLVDALRQRL